MSDGNYGIEWFSHDWDLLQFERQWLKCDYYAYFSKQEQKWLIYNYDWTTKKVTQSWDYKSDSTVTMSKSDS